MCIKLTTHLHQELGLRTTEAVPLLPLYAFMASQGYHHRYLLPKQSLNLGETTFLLFKQNLGFWGDKYCIPFS